MSGCVLFMALLYPSTLSQVLKTAHVMMAHAAKAEHKYPIAKFSRLLAARFDRGLGLPDGAVASPAFSGWSVVDSVFALSFTRALFFFRLSQTNIVN